MSLTAESVVFKALDGMKFEVGSKEPVVVVTVAMICANLRRRRFKSMVARLCSSMTEIDSKEDADVILESTAPQ